MTASKAHQTEVSERRRQLARLRRQGIRFDDERILNLGYSSASSARRDMNRALTRNRDEEKLEVSVYRQQENERLDSLLEAIWPRATEPSPVFDKEGNQVDEAIDMRAVDTALRLLDRRAKLNGLDMPVKAELSGPGGGAVPIGAAGIAELRSLINAAGDPDDQDGDLEGDSASDGDVDDDGDTT